MDTWMELEQNLEKNAVYGITHLLFCNLQLKDKSLSAKQKRFLVYSELFKLVRKSIRGQNGKKFIFPKVIQNIIRETFQDESGESTPPAYNVYHVTFEDLNSVNWDFCSSCTYQIFHKLITSNVIETIIAESNLYVNECIRKH